MHVNDIADTAMWTTATTDQDAVEHRALVVKASVALAGTWPFLAAAKNEEEFDHRVALMSEQIEAATPEHIRSEVVAGLKEKFAAVQAEANRHTAMLRTAARSIQNDGEGTLPQAYLHIHSHKAAGDDDSEYHQLDYVGGPNFLQTLARADSNDEAMTRAREYAQHNGLPIYSNGRYVEGKRIARDEEFFDAKNGQWVKASSLQRTAHQSWTSGGTGLHPSAGIADEAARARREANWGTHLAAEETPHPTHPSAGDPTVVNRAPQRTNYQPDPDMAQRYHYPIPSPTMAFGGQPSAPGSGSMDVSQQAAGSSIGADGFPIDVGQGEYAGAAAKMQQILTPGQWTVTPGTEWPVKPNAGHPNSPPVYASRQASYYDRAKPTVFHHPDGSEMYDKGYDHGHAGKRPVYTGHEDYLSGHSDGRSDHEVENAFGYPSSHAMASRRTATEGAAPTPGPNLNYFSQGTTGLMGPAEFPQDPSAGIEPKVSPHIDEGMFDNPPPEMSQGSAQGQADGAGYSRQATLTMHAGRGGYGATMDHGAEYFDVGWWPTKQAAVVALDEYVSHYQVAHKVAVRKVAPPDFPRSAEERTAARENFHGWNTAYWDMGSRHAMEQAAPHMRKLSEPNHAAYLDGYVHTLRSIPPASEEGQVTSSRGLPDKEDWPTRGEIERDERALPQQAGDGITRTDEQKNQRLQEILDYNKSGHASGGRTAATNGKIVGMCDHCKKPVRYHDDKDGHLQHLHSSSPFCSDGKRATAMRVTQDGVEYRLPLPKQGAVLEAPTPENPTGRGSDDFGARTWDSLVRQRPMQSAEDRDANTPTLPRDQIKTGPNVNTPNPGAQESNGPRERDDEDEDDDDDD